jgi:hypothetical protein
LVNGSKEHQVVCDRETSLVAGDPQFDYVNCNISNTYDGDPDRFRAEGSNNWLNGHWRAAPVPVYSGSLASGSGQNIVYSLADNGNIIIGVYGSCTITDPTLDQAGCLSTNYGIVAGAPTDFIALAATGVRDASGGFRVVLCGLHNHQFTCSKSTDLFGTTFGAWTSAPGRYASGPAIARWHSGSADGVASFALSTFDTQLWSTTQVGGTWSNPVSMSGDLMNVASVITLSKQDDPPVLMVFGRAHFSGQMWSTTVTPSGQSNWTPWF